MESFIFALTHLGTSGHLFFKVFSIAFSFIYLLYALVIWRQIPIMNRTLNTKGGPILYLISVLQIFAAVMMLLFAIALL